MLRRTISYFDPARAGFAARMWRLGRLALLLVASGLILGLVLMARIPATRYWWGVVQLESGFPAAAARTARRLVDEPDPGYAPYRLLATAQRRTGQIQAQLATFDQAVALYPESWSAQGNRCWYGALFGEAERVMDSCDRAAALAPETRGESMGWRAVARALTGDRAGAIADLEEALRRLDARGMANRPYATRRRQWLEQLRVGEDPFDEATLQAERERF